MKLLLCFILFSMLNVSGSIFSQSATFDLAVNGKTVKEVFKDIESQSDFRFLYNDDFTGLSRIVSFSTKDNNIDEVLSELLAGAHLTYRELENELIVITPVNLIEQQQTVTLTGTVADRSGDPLPGVNVTLKGTTIGTITNSDGKFSLTVPEDSQTLVFSFVGMLTREVPIVGTEFDIILESDVIGLEEVVAIGYGTALRRDVSGSISSVQVQEFETRQMNNILDMLRGSVAGFLSTPSAGPDGGGSMRIRGTTSIMASSDPLIVLDGTIFHGNIGEINPLDIESINVLKDASSAAVYGARAAAGVIEITTKKGVSEKPTINITSSVGWAEVGIDQKPYSPEGFLEMRKNHNIINYAGARPDNYFTHPDKLPSGLTVDEWIAMDPAAEGSVDRIWANRLGLTSTEITNYLEGNSINWYDQVFQRGLRQNHSINVSGRREDLSYFTSMQYMDNNDMIIDNRYKTVRGRVNMEYNVADFLSLGMNSQFVNTNDGFLYPSLTATNRSSPYGDKYNEDGSLTQSPIRDVNAMQNPFLYTLENFARVQRSLRSNIYGKLDLPAGFAVETRWVNRYSFGQNYRYTPSTHPNAEAQGGQGRRRETTSWDWNIDNLLTWNGVIADIHRLDFTFLWNVEKSQYWYTNSQNQTFLPNELLTYHQLASGLSPSVSSNDYINTGDALMGRVNYALLDRYLLTVSLRRDGYSAFGEANPHAIFPAASVGWIISEEGFFNIDWMNMFKLRLSYGVNGNRSIGGYSALAALSTTNYIYGDQSFTGIYPSRMANADLRWEQTTSYNVGLDFGLFTNKLSGSINAYKQSTADLLLNRSLPRIVGFDDIMANLGQVDNRGIELELRSINVDRFQTFTWRSSFTFSLNRNKIVHLYGNEIPVVDEQGNIIGYEEASDWSNGWYIGHSLHAIRNYKLLYVYSTDEAEEAARYQSSPGDWKLLDVNDDGQYMPQDDWVFQGETQPRYLFNLFNSFTLWENLDISFTLRALLDYKGSQNYHMNTGVYVNRTSSYDYPYWTEENQLKDWGALTTSGPLRNFGAQYYMDRSFLKLDNLSIAYTLPEKLIQNIALNNLRVYFNLDNGYTLTNWDFWDPETAGPRPKYFSFGVNATL